MVSLLSIYWRFFRISSITFGGGMTMLPILQREVVQAEAWVTDEEVIDMYALSQGLPGIIAVNVASFVGYRKRGVPGVIAAALGIVSPCILIIMIIAMFLKNFQDLLIVKNAFAGISVGVTALIFNSVLKVWKKSILDKFCIVIYIGTLLLMLFTSISPVIFVLAGAFIGILLKNRVDRV